MWYQLFKHALFVPYVRLLCRPDVEGVDRLPASGGVVLAANHISAGDSVLLAACMPRQMVYPAKSELFRPGQGIRPRVVAWFLRAVGQVPMDRGGGRASAVGLEPVLQALREGRVVGIFPEGTRSPDGRLYRGHTGVARIAMAAGVPVIPVAMAGTQLVRNRLGIPVMRRPRIVLGAPLDLGRSADTSPQDLRRATDRIMEAIQELTGQDYVDVYASRVKHGDLAGADLTDHLRARPGTHDPEEG